VNVGQTQPFTATGTFSDGSTQVLSSGTTLPSGVVSWWPGDGNASDASDGYPGVTLGGVAFAPGMVGQAFSFDGVDGDVWIGAKPNSTAPDGLTIDTWIFPQDLQRTLGSGPIIDTATVVTCSTINLPIRLQGSCQPCRCRWSIARPGSHRNHSGCLEPRGGRVFEDHRRGDALRGRRRCRITEYWLLYSTNLD
jgi:hypothetical protein